MKNNSYICNAIMKGSGPDFGLTFSEGVVPLTFFMPTPNFFIPNK